MKKIYFLTLFLIVALVKAQFNEITTLSGTTSQLVSATTCNSKHYFTNTNSSSELLLNVTDGTSAGTLMVKNFGTGNTFKYMTAGSTFLYILIRKNTTGVVELWRINTVDNSQLLLKSFDSEGAYNGIYFVEDRSLDKNNTIYFIGYSAAEGNEFWTTDGTVAGTQLFKDFMSGTGSSKLESYLRYSGKIYLSGANAATISSVCKLFSTTGVLGNFTEVLDYKTNVKGNSVRIFNGKLYFIGFEAYNYNTYPINLYTYDGTNLVIGSNIISDISGSNTSQTCHTSYVNNNYFIYTGYHNFETKCRAFAVNNLNNAKEILIDNGQYSTDFRLDNTYFYNKYSNTQGKYIAVYNIATDVQTKNYVPNYLEGVIGMQIPFDNKFYFTYSTASTGKEFYALNPANNTITLMEIEPGVTSSNPSNYFSNAQNLYFFANKSGAKKLFSLKEDAVFLGTQNSSWSNSANWKSLSVPEPLQNVLINAGTNALIDTDVSVYNMIANSTINLSTGSLSVNGNLFLNSKITLNNNNLNLKGGNSLITNGNTTNYIVTNGTGTVNVENLNSARGTVNLPIGTATNYNPISIANSGTSDTFSAKVSEGNTATNPTINATWEISEATVGGSNAIVTLGWNQSQENSGFDRNLAKVGHFVGGTWVQENSGTVLGTNPYTLSATGITSFSPFSVMNFSTLGNSEVEKSKVQVYPNPFNENLNISTQENGVVYFYDLSGKLVSTSILMKGNNQLQKSSLTKGIYFYNIKNTNGEIVLSGKVIKK